MDPLGRLAGSLADRLPAGSPGFRLGFWLRLSAGFSGFRIDFGMDFDLILI